MPPRNQQEQQEDDLSEESSSDEDDLALDGELVRSDEPAAKRARTASEDQQENDSDDEDVPASGLNVDFVFCDMEERFFHGISQFLNFTNAIVRNSLVSDAMIASTVGTVISTAADQEDEESKGNVYAYASIMVPNAAEDTSPASACATLIQYCQSHAPKTVDTDTMKLYLQHSQSHGILSHARMMNMPLELVPVLHQQLLLDLDYAIQHHDEQEDTIIDVRNLKHLVRLAPCTKEKGELVYKFFDDETLADAADASFMLPNLNMRVILMTLKAYRKAVVELQNMFPSAS